jgi:tetratricopeptide (TPR) repeat protein/SAM-dependent methyltransferase
LFAAAVAQHRAGALAEAERRYRYIIALYPDHADALHNLGLLALHAGNASSAAELIGKAIKINERVAEYHYNIALAWRALERMDKVATHLERAIALRGDHALAHLNLGNVRREQGRLVDAVACYERAIALTPASAAAHCNLANTLAKQERWDAAIASYQQALKLAPSYADAHSGLGAALIAQHMVDDAIGHFEQAAALKPETPAAHEDLAKAYLLTGKTELATGAAARALELEETDERSAFFVQCAKSMVFTADNGRFRKLILRAVSEGWGRPRELSNVCISLIKLNSAVSDHIARANAAWPARPPAGELFGASGMAALSRDELLCGLLESDPVTDIGLERLLTNVRCAMLKSATDGADDAELLGFYCLVARQCFINSYVFSMTEQETAQARKLRTSLEQALATGEPCPALAPAVVAAYFPLHALTKSERLLERSWPQCLDAVLVQQVKEPAQEREIAATIPLLTPIEDGVSRAVRQQYEENPYPRWVKPGPPVKPAILADPGAVRVSDILIAGCGTGLFMIELARLASHAHILAVDLSLASLSYAKRMARSLDITNLEFGQADITKLASLERQFDFIEVSGVLHHLADPWEGWRVLLSLLRPGGTMQIGLYSALARQNVVAARNLIAERGYRPTPEGIRRCREEIMASGDPLLTSLALWGDFFVIDDCRDLLFHVQEHRVTIPEIKTFLAANNLKFGGFAVPPPVLDKFAARFSAPEAMTDLDCWHVFETDAPRTFATMYVFSVQKPALQSDTTTADAR